MKTDWKVKTLGEVLDIQNGYAFDSKLFGTTGTQLIRIRDLKKGISTQTKYSGEFNSLYLVHKGDYLIGMDGEFKCFQWKGEPSLLNQRVCRLEKFSSEIYPRFLFYGVNKFLKDIEAVTAYTTVKHISARQIKEIHFPVPSIPEQKRIVKILDEKFEVIEQLKKITKEQLLSSKELFESRLSDVFVSGQKGWADMVLSDVCDIARGGSPRPIKNFITNKPEGVNWIKIGDVSKESKYIVSTKQKIKKEGVSRSRMVYPGNFLLSNSMSFGRPYILKIEGCIHDGWLVLSLDEKIINQNFLYHFLSSKSSFNQLDAMAQGSTVRNINIDIAAKLKLRIPTLEVQKQIVEELDELSEKTKELEIIFRKKIVDLEELKKSYLHEAFSGNL